MPEKTFSIAVTETGHNHIKSNPPKVCEDYSGAYDEEGIHICVVADGHGSDNYPRTYKGSRFAVEACLKQLPQFVNDFKREGLSIHELEEKKDDFEILRGLVRSILNEWYLRVESDLKENAFEEDELKNVSEKYRLRYTSDDPCESRKEKAYGTTLIAFVITDAFSFGLQIGDGKCVVIDSQGNFNEPIPWDAKCEMNVTTSICDENAVEEFRFFVTENKPAAVFCGTDGIEDSYVNVDEVYAFYRAILEIFVEEGYETGISEIREYLPTLTKRGSGDDVSISGIINSELSATILPLLKLQDEAFRLENEKEALVQKRRSLSSRREQMGKQGEKFLRRTQIADHSYLLSNDETPDDLIGSIKKTCKELEECDKALCLIESKMREISQQRQQIIDQLNAFSNKRPEENYISEGDLTENIEIPEILDISLSEEDEANSVPDVSIEDSDQLAE